MAQVTSYQSIIKDALQEYAKFLTLPPQMPYRVAVVFDDDHYEYLVRKIGWAQKNRVWQTVLHVSIQNNKIWIEEDWTEEGVATYFLEHGISNQEIVLGFQPPNMREYTEFAAA